MFHKNHCLHRLCGWDKRSSCWRVSVKRLFHAGFVFLHSMPLRLCEQNPTRLIKPSVLTGLIFTRIHSGRRWRSSNTGLAHCCRFVGSPSLVEILPHAGGCMQKGWVLRGAVGRGWFHVSSFNCSPGPNQPDGRVEASCPKSPQNSAD